MKKNRYITLSIVLLCLLAALAGGVRLFRYYLPHEGPTDALYEKYKDNPQVKASLLHDFRVNDTRAVDALLLEASTDSAWCALLLDFGMPEEMITDYISNRDFFMGEGRSSIIRIFINKYNPKERVPVADTNGWLTIGSFEKKSLSVFLTGEYSVKEIINKKEIKKLKIKNQKDEKVL